MNIIAKAVASAVIASGVVVGGTAAPAMADWNGYCATQNYAASAWGWCDGTGPQRYAIYILCSNSGVYRSSVQPWFGDRRGAWAYCPAGTYTVASWGARA